MMLYCLRSSSATILLILRAPLLLRWFYGFFGQQLGTTLSTVVMTIIVLIFGEVTPKQIAKEKAESLCNCSCTDC